MAMKRLILELKEIKKDPNYYYSISPSEGNFLKWDFSIIGPQDTLYEGGIFKGHINFDKTYPIKAPKVYIFDIIHPNIFSSGKVCISILHEGVDQYGYESSIERWLPTHGINTIMVSIISMLSAPNFESPANVDVSKLWKDDPDNFKKKLYHIIALSQ